MNVHTWIKAGLVISFVLGTVFPMFAFAETIEERILEQTARSFARLQCPDLNNFDPEMADAAFARAFKGNKISDEWLSSLNKRVKRLSEGKVKILRGVYVLNSIEPKSLIPGPHEIISAEHIDGRSTTYLITSSSLMGCEEKRSQFSLR